MQNATEIIEEEQKKLSIVSDPGYGLNILYNLIILKNKYGKKKDNYKDFKKFIDFYIEVVKLSDYGYDKLNHSKILKLLSLLSHEEQISALNYAISVSARELPEHDKDWFIKEKHSSEIRHIFKNRIYKLYFKGAALYIAKSIYMLLFLVFFFFILVTIVLLPAPSKDFVIFQIKYDSYSSNFYINHILNILTHFADLDNEFQITPINWFGVLLIIFGKLFFLLIVVNFIYRKISDKLNIK